MASLYIDDPETAAAAAAARVFRRPGTGKTRARFRRVDIGSDQTAAAIDAGQRYGKGRHPAQRNMGDCFAYAGAHTNHARLPYKGDDFARTDLA